MLLVAASKSRAGFVVKVNQTLSQQFELGAAGLQSELGNIDLQLTLLTKGQHLLYNMLTLEIASALPVR